MTYERYNKPNLQDHRLDLHGLRKEEALRLLEKILFMKISEVNSKLGEKESREPYELNIVTGIGNHSKRVILRPAVKNFFSCKWNWI